MAQLYQFHEGDFERSIVEAEAAAKLVPYDPLPTADLAFNLALPEGPSRRSNGWRRRSDATPARWTGISQIWPSPTILPIVRRMPWRSSRKCKEPWHVHLAAAYVRLGKLDEARASIATLLKNEPGWTIKREATWPTGRQPQAIESLLEPLSRRSGEGRPAGRVKVASPE